MGRCRFGTPSMLSGACPNALCSTRVEGRGALSQGVCGNPRSRQRLRRRIRSPCGKAAGNPPRRRAGPQGGTCRDHPASAALVLIEAARSRKLRRGAVAERGRESRFPACLPASADPAAAAVPAAAARPRREPRAQPPQRRSRRHLGAARSAPAGAARGVSRRGQAGPPAP